MGTDLSSLSNAQLMSMLGAASQGASGPSSAPNQYTAAVNQNESRGASDSAAGIVNPASGARGNMQVMPTTAARPGFGVAPSDGTPQGDARTGRQYINAMVQRYGDPVTGAMAYDWGPGNVDNWLKNGADLSKVPNETLKYALNFAKQIGQGGGDANVASGSQLPSAQWDDFVKNLPSSSPAAEAADNTPWYQALGAGVGRGVQEGALGAQALVGKGLKKLGLDETGDALINDAQAGNAAGAQELAANGGNSFIGKAGQVIGGVAPAMLLPAEALPQIAGAGIMGAGNAALNNEDVAKGAVSGAASGALGVAGGHAVAGIVGALSPKATALMTALRGGDDSAAANIAKGMSPAELNSVIGNLKNNSDAATPGYQPTAAEVSQSPAIVRAQRAARNTPEGQAYFSNRDAENSQAIMDAGQNAVGPSSNNSQMMGPGLEHEAQAFTQAQAQRITQGQQELPPINDAQAAVMKTPAYQQAINGARRSAANSGQTAFVDQSNTLNRGLADQIDQVAGTPETLEQLRATRSAQGNGDYAGVQGPVPADTPQFADLAARPGFNTALRRAAGIEDDMNGSAAADPLTRGPATRSLVAAPDGSLNWVEKPGAVTAEASLLQGARSQLSGMASQAAQAGNAPVAAGYRSTLEALDNFLSSHEIVGPDIANAFTKAKGNYAANSVPIDQQTYLQSKLSAAVNNLTGEVNPGTINSTINAVGRDQLKPGLRPADRITPEQLATLQNIGEQAREAPTNMGGLNGQGQEAIRQQLTQTATKSADAQAARDAFNKYLGQNSPSYAAHEAAEQTTGAQLASRQTLADSLDKLAQGTHNAGGVPNITYTGAKRALANADLTGPQAEFAQGLLSDLQRSTAANAAIGAAGSPTSANEALKGASGLLGKLSHGSTLNAAISGGEVAGHLGAALSVAAQKLVGKAAAEAQEKTVQSTLELLGNPKKLAQALEKYRSQPTAAQAFVDALKTKALKAGKVGSIAVQAFEAANR